MARNVWSATSLLSGSVMAGLVVVVAVTSAPRALDGLGALLPPAVGLLLLGYGAVAVTGLTLSSPGQRWGIEFGLVAGTLWLVEICAGGPLLLPRSLEVAVGGFFAAAAVATTVAFGVWAALRGGTAAGVWTGLITGLFSGLMVFSGGVVMTLLFIDRLGSRSDYRHQLAHSHMASMRAFLIQDALTGYGAHLLINPLLGLAGSGFGWMVLRHRPRFAQLVPGTPDLPNAPARALSRRQPERKQECGGHVPPSRRGDATFGTCGCRLPGPGPRRVV